MHACSTGENPCKKLNCTFMCVSKTQQPTCICKDGTLVEANKPCTGSKEKSKKVENHRGIIVLSILGVMLAIGLLYYCYRKELLNCWRRIKTDNTYVLYFFYLACYMQSDFFFQTILFTYYLCFRVLSFRNLLYDQNTDGLFNSAETVSTETSSAISNLNSNDSTDKFFKKHEYVNPLASEVLQPRVSNNIV